MENIKTVAAHDIQGKAESCSQAVCVCVGVCERGHEMVEDCWSATVCSDCVIISHGTANTF